MTIFAGVPYAVSGAIYILLFSRWFLAGEDSKRHSDLLFAARAGRDSTVVGQTVCSAGLNRMERLLLVAAERRVGHACFLCTSPFSVYAQLELMEY